MSRLATVAVVLAAAASAVLLNVLLLNQASSSNDPVGKLTPAAAWFWRTAIESTLAASAVRFPSTARLRWLPAAAGFRG